MIIFILIIISILPAFIMGKYIYKKDTDKEPKKILRKIIVLSVLIAFLAAILEGIYNEIIPISNSFASILLKYIIGVALIEELCKFVVAYRIGIKSEHFDDVYDAIVYTTFSALGFAAIENLFYVLKGGIITGALRTIFSVPGHVAYGIMMGYFIGIAYKEKTNKNIKSYIANMLLSILVPTLFHGIDDFVIVYGVEKLNFIAIILNLLVDLGFIIYAFKKLKNVAKRNEKIYQNTQYKKIGAKLLIFGMFLIVLFYGIFSFNSDNLLNIFGIYYLNDTVAIKEDNVNITVNSYEEIGTQIKINITINNSSNNSITLNESNLDLEEIVNKKNIKLNNINTNNLLPLTIDANESITSNIYFEISEDNDKRTYIFVYNPVNSSKEYGIILENNLSNLK